MSAKRKAVEDLTLDRAREIASAHADRPGFIGAFLYGSSSRPYGDASSDIDVLCVFENDALDAIALEDRYFTEHADGRKSVDMWMTSPKELEILEARRRSAMMARIVIDRTGALSALIGRLSKMPPLVREHRMRVCYYEMKYAAQKLRSAQRRDKTAAIRILTAEIVLAGARLLFAERGEWSAPLTWTFEELALSGVPADIIEALRRVARNGDERSVRALRGLLDAYLLGRGITFVADPVELWNWIMRTREGARARAEWGGEISRSG